jgi:hypothetical protein
VQLPKNCLRLIALFLISGLIFDPITASAVLSPISPIHGVQTPGNSLFKEQALVSGVIRVHRFILPKAFAPAVETQFYRGLSFAKGTLREFWPQISFAALGVVMAHLGHPLLGTGGITIAMTPSFSRVVKNPVGLILKTLNDSEVPMKPESLSIAVSDSANRIFYPGTISQLVGGFLTIKGLVITHPGSITDHSYELSPFAKQHAQPIIQYFLSRQYERADAQTLIGLNALIANLQRESEAEPVAAPKPEPKQSSPASYHPSAIPTARPQTSQSPGQKPKVMGRAIPPVYKVFINSEKALTKKEINEHLLSKTRWDYFHVDKALSFLMKHEIITQPNSNYEYSLTPLGRQNSNPLMAFFVEMQQTDQTVGYVQMLEKRLRQILSNSSRTDILQEHAVKSNVKNNMQPTASSPSPARATIAASVPGLSILNRFKSFHEMLSTLEQERGWDEESLSGKTGIALEDYQKLKRGERLPDFREATSVGHYLAFPGDEAYKRFVLNSKPLAPSSTIDPAAVAAEPAPNAASAPAEQPAQPASTALAGPVAETPAPVQVPHRVPESIRTALANIKRRDSRKNLYDILDAVRTLLSREEYVSYGSIAETLGRDYYNIYPVLKDRNISISDMIEWARSAASRHAEGRAPSVLVPASVAFSQIAKIQAPASPATPPAPPANVPESVMAALRAPESILKHLNDPRPAHAEVRMRLFEMRNAALLTMRDGEIDLSAIANELGTTYQNVHQNLHNWQISKDDLAVWALGLSLKRQATVSSPAPQEAPEIEVAIPAADANQAGDTQLPASQRQFLKALGLLRAAADPDRSKATKFRTALDNRIKAYPRWPQQLKLHMMNYLSQCIQKGETFLNISTREDLGHFMNGSYRLIKRSNPAWTDQLIEALSRDIVAVEAPPEPELAIAGALPEGNGGNGHKVVLLPLAQQIEQELARVIQVLEDTLKSAMDLGQQAEKAHQPEQAHSIFSQARDAARISVITLQGLFDLAGTQRLKALTEEIMRHVVAIEANVEQLSVKLTKLEAQSTPEERASRLTALINERIPKVAIGLEARLTVQRPLSLYVKSRLFEVTAGTEPRILKQHIISSAPPLGRGFKPPNEGEIQTRLTKTLVYILQTQEEIYSLFAQLFPEESRRLISPLPQATVRLKTNGLTNEGGPATIIAGQGQAHEILPVTPFVEIPEPAVSPSPASPAPALPTEAIAPPELQELPEPAAAGLESDETVTASPGLSEEAPASAVDASGPAPEIRMMKNIQRLLKGEDGTKAKNTIQRHGEAAMGVISDAENWNQLSTRIKMTSAALHHFYTRDHSVPFEEFKYWVLLGCPPLEIIQFLVPDSPPTSGDSIVSKKFVFVLPFMPTMATYFYGIQAGEFAVSAMLFGFCLWGMVVLGKEVFSGVGGATRSPEEALRSSFLNRVEGQRVLLRPLSISTDHDRQLRELGFTARIEREELRDQFHEAVLHYLQEAQRQPEIIGRPQMAGDRIRIPLNKRISGYAITQLEIMIPSGAMLSQTYRDFIKPKDVKNGPTLDQRVKGLGAIISFIKQGKLQVLVNAPMEVAFELHDAGRDKLIAHLSPAPEEIEALKSWISTEDEEINRQRQDQDRQRAAREAQAIAPKPEPQRKLSEAEEQINSHARAFTAVFDAEIVRLKTHWTTRNVIDEMHTHPDISHHLMEQIPIQVMRDAHIVSHERFVVRLEDLLRQSQQLQRKTMRADAAQRLLTALEGLYGFVFASADAAVYYEHEQRFDSHPASVYSRRQLNRLVMHWVDLRGSLKRLTNTAERLNLAIPNDQRDLLNAGEYGPSMNLLLESVHPQKSIAALRRLLKQLRAIGRTYTRSSAVENEPYGRYYREMADELEALLPRMSESDSAIALHDYLDRLSALVAGEVINTPVSFVHVRRAALFRTVQSVFVAMGWEENSVWAYFNSPLELVDTPYVSAGFFNWRWWVYDLTDLFLNSIGRWIGIQLDRLDEAINQLMIRGKTEKAKGMRAQFPGTGVIALPFSIFRATFLTPENLQKISRPSILWFINAVLLLSFTFEILVLVRYVPEISQLATRWPLLAHASLWGLAYGILQAIPLRIAGQPWRTGLFYSVVSAGLFGVYAANPVLAFFMHGFWSGMGIFGYLLLYSPLSPKKQTLTSHSISRQKTAQAA